MHDLALGGVDEPHAARVGCELVDFVEGVRRKGQRRTAGVCITQVDLQEVIGGSGAEFRLLLVGSAHQYPCCFSFLTRWLAMKPPAPQTNTLFMNKPRCLSVNYEM